MSSVAAVMAVVVAGFVFGGVILRIVGFCMMASGLVAAMTSSLALSSAQQTLMIAGGVVAWLLGHWHFSLLYRQQVRDGNRMSTYRPYESPVAGLMLDLLAGAWRLLTGVLRRPAGALGRHVLVTSHRGPQSTVALPPHGDVAEPDASYPVPIASAPASGASWRHPRRRRGGH